MSSKWTVDIGPGSEHPPHVAEECGAMAGGTPTSHHNDFSPSQNVPLHINPINRYKPLQNGRHLDFSCIHQFLTLVTLGRTGTLRRGAGLESPLPPLDTVLFLRRFLSGAGSTSPSRLVADILRLGGREGIGGTPPLVMKAMPRRWRGSAESNLAGKKTIGKLESGMGRWNAWDVSMEEHALIQKLTTPSAWSPWTMLTKGLMSSSLHRTIPMVTGRRPSRAKVETGIMVAV